MLINTIYYSATARDYVDHDNNLSQKKNKQLPPTPEKPSNSGIVGNTEELHDNIVYSIIPERQTESPKVKRKPAPRRWDWWLQEFIPLGKIVIVCYTTHS